MYADDTNIDAVTDEINKVENVLNNELAIVVKCCTDNKLITSGKKTNSLVICNYQKRRFFIKVTNVTSDKTLVLGVHLDNNLLMDTHIDNLCLMLSRLCPSVQNSKLSFFSSHVVIL